MLRSIVYTTLVAGLGFFGTGCSGESDDRSNASGGGGTAGTAGTSGGSSSGGSGGSTGGTSGSGGRSLLSKEDLSCTKLFLTPTLGAGPYWSNHPLTYRYVNGVRRWLSVDGVNNHLVEFEEPAGAPCNAEFDALEAPAVLTDWGPLPAVHTSSGDGFAIGGSSVRGTSITWDPATEKLVISWSGIYSNIPTGTNAFAVIALDDATQTLKLEGCHALENAPHPQSGAGLVLIPDQFVNEANLPPGARWAVRGAAIGSVGAGVTMGPSLKAIVPPAPNACAFDTDYPVPFTELQVYNWNVAGPTCSGIGLGCKPSAPPTEPMPRKMAHTNYSFDLYAVDWDPWEGHGWFVSYVNGTQDWYDDGVKYGLVDAYAAPDGYLNTTVEPSPPPAIEPPPAGDIYPILTMTLPTLDTHGGTTLQLGDFLWVQTCTPGVDPPGPAYPCDTTNGHHLATGPVIAIDTATRVVKVRKIFGEQAGGDHVPVVGGGVYMGAMYTWGSPSLSRAIYKAQISDPAELAAVAEGTMKPWEPSFVEEFDMTELGITQFGCPLGCSKPGVSSFFDNHGLTPIPDSGAGQLMILAGQAKTAMGIQNNAVYVFDVAH